MSPIYRNQQGMTFTGWLVVLALIGFFALVGMKIVPIYLQNYSVRTVVQSLEDEPLISRKSSNEIRKIIMRRFDINGIYDLKRDHVSVKVSPGIMDVSVVYDVRKKMVGNLDIIVSFDERIRLVSN
ncbi:MAG: DUF4845 domain-containing protein [Sedimenticola sp.]